MQINLYLTHPAAPDLTTELPDDPATTARGRNGWFRPRQIAIWRGERIWLAIRSRRPSENAPIQLQLARTTAHALAGALLVATAADSDPGVPSPSDHAVADEPSDPQYTEHGHAAGPVSADDAGGAPC